MEVGRVLYPSRAVANYYNLTIAGPSPTLSRVWWSTRVENQLYEESSGREHNPYFRPAGNTLISFISSPDWKIT